MRLLPSLIFVRLLFFATYALSAGEPYGKYFVQLDAIWPKEAPPVTATRPVPMERSAAAELQRTLGERLTEQEYRDGPYAMGLAETLDELARAQEAAGAVEDASRSRERALHLIRVNDGLYSAAQRPILRSILDSLRRDEDFAALDERYDYFFRLYGSGQAPWNELRWSAVLEYLRWQREALRLGIDGDPMPRLLRLHGLHEDLLESLVLQKADLDYRKLADATYSQLKTLYFIEDLIRPPPAFREQRNGFYRPEDPRDFNLQLERLQNLQRTLRGSGRRLIEDLLSAIPTQDSLARAQAILALADWLQWQGATREAQALYEGLWGDMHRQGLAALARSWFSNPVALPDNGVFYQRGQQEAQGPMAVLLSVRESGRASADVAPLSPQWQRSAIALQRYIAATRFRPVVDNGQVTTVDKLPVSYWLLRP